MRQHKAKRKAGDRVDVETRRGHPRSTGTVVTAHEIGQVSLGEVVYTVRLDSYPDHPMKYPACRVRAIGGGA